MRDKTFVWYGCVFLRGPPPPRPKNNNNTTTAEEKRWFPFGFPVKATSKGCSHRCPFWLFVLVEKIDGPGLPGGLILYQGHLYPAKGHL